MPLAGPHVRRGRRNPARGHSVCPAARAAVRVVLAACLVIIFFAGAAFGWMRHRTGSTAAAALMHAGYNLVFFAGLLAQRHGTFTANTHMVETIQWTD